LQSSKQDAKILKGMLQKSSIVIKDCMLCNSYDALFPLVKNIDRCLNRISIVTSAIDNDNNNNVNNNNDDDDESMSTMKGSRNISINENNNDIDNYVHDVNDVNDDRDEDDKDLKRGNKQQIQQQAYHSINITSSSYLIL
jgi:hypothetical protein